MDMCVLGLPSTYSLFFWAYHSLFLQESILSSFFPNVIWRDEPTLWFQIRLSDSGIANQGRPSPGPQGWTINSKQADEIPEVGDEALDSKDSMSKATHEKPKESSPWHRRWNRGPTSET